MRIGFLEAPVTRFFQGQNYNDILSGGYDQQAEDLIVGGQGDDVFLLAPDYLPQVSGSGFDAGNSDLFVGGSGNDQVYFVGGATQNLGGATTPVELRLCSCWI